MITCFVLPLINIGTHSGTRNSFEGIIWKMKFPPKILSLINWPYTSQTQEMSTKFLFAHQKFTIMAKIPNEAIDEYFGRTFKFWVTSRVLKFPPRKTLLWQSKWKKGQHPSGLEPTTLALLYSHCLSFNYYIRTIFHHQGFVQRPRCRPPTPDGVLGDQNRSLRNSQRILPGKIWMWVITNWLLLHE